MDRTVQTYIDGSPALDPKFVQLRERVFDADRSWIKAAGATLGVGMQKLGPFQARTLSSAFGWEIRPWTKSPVLDEASVDEFAESLEAGNWDMGQLNSLSEQEAALFRQRLSRIGARVFDFPYPVHVISGAKSYQDYLVRRGKSFLKTQRRYFKNLLAAGLVFRDQATWSGIERVLDSRTAIFDNGADYTKSPKFREFFKAFFEEMTTSGRLICAGVFEGEKLVGYTIGFWSGPVYHCYQTAFDPAYKQYRVGALTVEKNIELALDKGAQVIDFMNSDPYLDFYTKELLPLKRIVFFSNGLRGRLLATLFKLRSAR